MTLQQQLPDNSNTKFFLQKNIEKPENDFFQETTLFSFNKLQEYDKLFCGDGYAPYIKIKKQGSDKKVITINKGKITLDKRKKHLQGIDMTGTRAKWYPVWSIFDFDLSGDDRKTKLKELKKELNILENEFEINGSMRFEEKEHFHFVIRPEIFNKTTYLSKQRAILKPIADKLDLELYPQANKKVSDPFSPYQPLLNKETLQPITNEWLKCMEVYKKIEPFNLGKAEKQGNLDLKYTKDLYKKKSGTKQLHIPLKAKCEELIENGLQAFSTRHKAILDLSCYYSLSNITPGQAIYKIRNWLHKKNNGKSHTVNNNKWNDIEYDIKKIVKWAYSKYVRYDILPNEVHNIGYGIAQSHLDLIAGYFPGDVVNQRRMFNLLCYYNPRSHWDYVFIHRDIWFDIVSSNYKQFQNLLIKKGILKTINSYEIGKFSKRFKLIGLKPDKNYISYNARNLNSFEEVVNLQDIGYLKRRFKWSRMAINRLKCNKLEHIM